MLVSTSHISHSQLKGRGSSRDSGQWRDRWKDKWAKKKVRCIIIVDSLSKHSILNHTLFQGEWETGDGSSEADRDEYFKKVSSCWLQFSHYSDQRECFISPPISSRLLPLESTGISLLDGCRASLLPHHSV